MRRTNDPRSARVGLVLGSLAMLWSGTWSSMDAGEAGETIAAIRVVGCRRFAEPRVLNEINLRKDQPFDQHGVYEALRRLERTQWYASVVPEVQREPEGVVITFRVVERPVIQEVIYEGAKHLSREELESLTGLKKGSPMSVASNHLARQAILRKYYEKGRLLADVKLLEGGKDEDLRVVFQITEGPIVRIRDIRFEGNTFVTDARLKTQIDSGERVFGVFGGKYRPELLDLDVHKLIDYYKTFGFFSVKAHRELRWNPGTESVDVVFVIEEGPRYRVESFEVAGSQQVDPAVLLKDNQLKQGELFNGIEMGKGVRKMQDEYGKRGYVTTRVVPDYRFYEDQGVVTVVYQVVDERLPARVGDIRIAGNTVTKDRIILRELAAAGVLPGQTLDVPATRVAEANLRRLRIFKEDPAQGIFPSIEIVDPAGPSEFKDLYVQVEEDRTGSLLFGVGVSSDLGASASVVVNERNFDIFRFPRSLDDILANRAFRGAGQEFRLEIVPGTELSRYSISWREPRLFDGPNSLGTSGYYYTHDFDDYRERRTGGKVILGRRLTPEWSGSLSSRVEGIKISEVPSFAPAAYQEVLGNNFVAAPRVAVIYDSTDSFLRPTEGSRIELSYEHGFGSFSYPIANLEGTQFFTTRERPDGSGRHVLSFRGHLAFAGDDTPLYDRLYAGGRSFRGFAYRGVGPKENGFELGGMFLMIGSVEYQVPILATDHLYAVAFTDFGTVEDDVAIRDLRVSVGFGFRAVIPMFGPVPLALDFGFPIKRLDTDDRRVVDFSVGFSR